MLATRLTLTALIGLALFGCGKEDRTAPPRVPPMGAGRDSGPSAGSGGSRPDGGTPEDAGVPGCLKSGGAGSVTTLEGEIVTDPIEGRFEVETLEVTTEGATTTLLLEIVGGDPDLDAGGGESSYRVELIMTALPRDQVRIGDVIDLVWTTHEPSGQASTLIVTRDGALLFFATHSWPDALDAESLLPLLEPFGIALRTGDASCEFTSAPCNYREHALRAKSGDEEGSASATGLVRAGDLTVAGRVLERLPGEDECLAHDGTLIASGFMKR